VSVSTWIVFQAGVSSDSQSRLLRVLWTRRKTNEWMLLELSEERQLLQSIKRCKSGTKFTDDLKLILRQFLTTAILRYLFINYLLMILRQLANSQNIYSSLKTKSYDLLDVLRQLVVS